MVFFIFVSCFNTAIAEQEKFYTVKMGEIPSQVLPQNAMYAKPVFSRGTAFFRDGTTSGQQFNYNFLLDEMHFVGAAGDTLAIANPVLLKSVVIELMVFYYENGYLQESLKSGKYILAVKRKMVQVVNQNRGGYDATSETGAIKTFNSVILNNQNYKLQVRTDVLFQLQVNYYIGLISGSFVKASRKNFHLLFPDKDIKTYLKQTSVNFNKPDDLKALLQFWLSAIMKLLFNLVTPYSSVNFRLSSLGTFAIISCSACSPRFLVSTKNKMRLALAYFNKR